MFHIVDEDLDIVDSSNNMLELRLICDEVNYRFDSNCKVTSAEELSEEKQNKQKDVE